ncbi:MAG: hypothetical protein WBN93_01985, partial [Acidimicrobiia bacterium]
FAQPETPEEQELAKDIAPAYGEALKSAMPSLIDQLEIEYANRITDRGPEPEMDLGSTAVTPDPSTD